MSIHDQMRSLLRDARGASHSPPPASVVQEQQSVAPAKPKRKRAAKKAAAAPLAVVPDLPEHDAEPVAADSLATDDE